MTTLVSQDVIESKIAASGNSKNVYDEAIVNNMLLEDILPATAEEQFLMRPTRMSDLEAAVEMFTTCSMHMIGENEVSISDVRNEWLLPEFDLQNATRIVLTPEGKVVGYIELWDLAQIPTRIWVWGRVHPAYEGQGIGSQLMDWAENRARQAIGRVPDGIQVVMHSGNYSTYDPALQLLEDRGMTPIRSFYTMAIEISERPPAASLPPGLTIRTMTGEEELRDVVLAVEDAFRDHWGHVEQPIEQEYERWLHFVRHDADFDPTLWFLVMDGDQIAGVSLCDPKSNHDHNMGWVSTLGVRRPWRRQGVGLALLHHSFQEFRQRGQSRVGLGVDTGSLTGATRLYERAGMKPIRQFNTLEKVLRPGRDISTQTVE